MPRCRSLSNLHDPDLSRMLIVFIATGLSFMLLPGTFVGVVNLLKISAAHTSHAADAGWIQAHGHAQIFGWLAFSRIAAWTTYGFWTVGVALRWAAGSWPPARWRVLFALSGVLDPAASRSPENAERLRRRVAPRADGRILCRGRLHHRAPHPSCVLQRPQALEHEPHGRVAQILAYEAISAWSWNALPVSAVAEMTAVTLFAVNMLMTLTTGSPLKVYLQSLEQSEA